MINQWHELLTEQGAKTTQRSLHFNDPKIEQTLSQHAAIIAPLINRTIIHCSGPDAKPFLQGQLTCNLNEVNEHESRLGAYCNQKGRTLAVLRIYQKEADYYLDVALDVADNLLNELKKFILRAKVNLALQNKFIQVGVSNVSPTHLQAIAGNLPDSANAILHTQVTFIHLAGKPSRWQIIGDFSVISKLWLALRAIATPVGPDTWTFLDILNGIPTIHPETIAMFTPHSLNLKDRVGLSFNKGCYRGQEIIARMEYLGKSKQTMFQVLVNTDSMPKPGLEILNATGQIAGYIVTSALDPESGYRALAVLNREMVMMQDIKLSTQEDKYIRIVS